MTDSRVGISEHRARLSAADLLRVKYNLGCGYANKALELREEGPGRHYSVGSGGSVRLPPDSAELQRAERLALSVLVSALIEDRTLGFDPVDDELTDNVMLSAAELSVLVSALNKDRLSGLDPVDDELTYHVMRSTAALLAGVWAVQRAPSQDPTKEGDKTAAAPGRLSNQAFKTELIRVLANAAQRPHEELIALLGDAPELGGSADAYARACYHAVRAPYAGELDLAFRALSVSITDSALRTWAQHDPWLDAMRSDPRWQSLYPPAVAPEVQPTRPVSDVIVVETLADEQE